MAIGGGVVSALGSMSAGALLRFAISLSETAAGAADEAADEAAEEAADEFADEISGARWQPTHHAMLSNRQSVILAPFMPGYR